MRAHQLLMGVFCRVLWAWCCGGVEALRFERLWRRRLVQPHFSDTWPFGWSGAKRPAGASGIQYRLRKGRIPSILLESGMGPRLVCPESLGGSALSLLS